MGPPPMITIPADPVSEYFLVLYRYFRAAGCCSGHAMYLAIRAIEGPAFVRPPSFCKRTWCEISGRGAWLRRPKVHMPTAAATEAA